jgi:hypothetical protein
MSLNMNSIYTLVEPTNKMVSRLRYVKGEQPQNKTPAFAEPMHWHKNFDGNVF